MRDGLANAPAESEPLPDGDDPAPAQARTEWHGTFQTLARPRPWNGAATPGSMRPLPGRSNPRNNVGRDVVDWLESSDQADRGCVNGLATRPTCSGHARAVQLAGRRSKGWIA